MIEMSVVVFILMVVLFLVIAFAAFLVGVFAGAYAVQNENEKKFNSTEVAKFEN